MTPTAQAVLAAVILLAVIGAVLTFAVWIGRMMLRDYREHQRLDANYERWELAESINRLEHDLGFHATPEESCRSCQWDSGHGYLPVPPDRQRR